MADEQKVCTVTLTNGDATVAGSGQSWLTDLAALDIMGFYNGGYTPIAVASVTDDNHLELASAWGGTTGSYAVVFQRSFTTNLHLPRPATGDRGVGELLAQALDTIDSLLGALVTSGNYARRLLTASPGADHSWSGDYAQHTAGENLVFGELCYMKSDGKYWKADADASTTMPGLVLALASISAEASGNFLHMGIIRDDSWTLTVGALSGLIFADGATAGAMTQTPPSGSGDQVQCLGYALTSHIMMFNPSPVVIEMT
jgi:hypothetical protein